MIQSTAITTELPDSVGIDHGHTSLQSILPTEFDN